MSATKFGVEFKNMLTFIEPAGKNKWHIKLGLYKCECGNTTICSISSVQAGKIKSCGCLKKIVGELIGQKSKTHNLTKHPLYYIWAGIISRCESPNNSRYDRYLGRGVEICPEWRHDFECFYNWAIANGWKKGLEIDKDIKGNGLLYSPDTCLIVTRKQNCNKRSNNRVETYRGMAKTVAQWAEEMNMNPFLIYGRLRKGWSISEAIETPLKIYNKKSCHSI